MQVQGAGKWERQVRGYVEGMVAKALYKDRNWLLGCGLRLLGCGLTAFRELCVNIEMHAQTGKLG